MPDGTGYDQDFYLWSLEQARRLRALGAAQSNSDLDWENVAEEIESLGRSDKRELLSRLDMIYGHLLKLQCSSATDPRNGRMSTVQRGRNKVRRLLWESPSLLPAVEAWVNHESADVIRHTSQDLRCFGEAAAAEAVALITGTELAKRVLEDDFFPHPPEPTTSDPPTSE